jgi:hypothetical protein
LWGTTTDHVAQREKVAALFELDRRADGVTNCESEETSEKAT